MNIEILSIGNEILTGGVVNTNAAEIGQALFKAGYGVQRQTSVPDDSVLLKQGLAEAMKRSRLVVATGGLGPTCDDVTRQAAAELFGSGFRYDESIAEDLRKRYGELSISLKDQATVPSKAIILWNPVGTAPGLVFESDMATLILMPGVPKEMRLMLTQQAMPYIKTNFPLLRRYVSQSVYFFMLSESSADPVLRKLQLVYPEVEFGIYPGHGILSICATLLTDDQEAGMRVIASILEEVKAHFKDHWFEASSGKIEEAVHQLFIERHWTLSVAESCTGGQVSSRLTRLPGASIYFLGGVVSYSNGLKQSLLGVREELIMAHGAVSKEVATDMAEGVVRMTGSDFGIAVSGIAGPSGGTPEKPVGTVWIAAAGKGKQTISRKFQAHGTREMIIEWSVNALLGELLNYCRK